MHRLILFRHAKTEVQSASGEDFDRRLTARGCADAALMAKVLSDAGLVPDKVLVSAAARAQETWAQMSPHFPQAAAETQAQLYLASAEILLMAAEGEREAETVMIVAHNPGLHDAALELSRGGRSAGALRRRLLEGMPTAAAVVFVFEPEGPRLEAVHWPTHHGGGARK